MKPPGKGASPVRARALERLILSSRAPEMGREAPARQGAGDRRERAQGDRLVRGILRHLTLLDAYLGRPGLFDPAKTPERLRWILRIAAHEHIFQSHAPDYAIGQQAVALARETEGPRAGRFVNAVLRRLLAALPDSPQAVRADPYYSRLPPSTRWSIPSEIVSVYEEAFGAKSAHEVLESLSEREAPVWLRVNRLKTDSDELAGHLRGEGVETNPWPPLPEALCWVSGKLLPWETDAWEQGLCTVQDLGSMLAVEMLGVEPGQAVLDACAAPGGKTGYLWEKMRGRGRLVGLEVNPRRRTELIRGVERLFGPDHGIEIPDAGDLESFALTDRNARRSDRVLVDAPCLSLGLIGRHPEVRWQRRLRSVGAMAATQRRVLDHAACCARDGGRLLWVTCSPTRMENESVVEGWLDDHSEWRALDPLDQLPPVLLKYVQIDRHAVRTRPDLMACDGFAMILLERGKAS